VEEDFYAIYDEDGLFVGLIKKISKLDLNAFTANLVLCLPTHKENVRWNLQQLCDLANITDNWPEGKKYDRAKAAKKEQLLSELDTICESSMDFGKYTNDF
jgi:hypothetical protein